MSNKSAARREQSERLRAVWSYIRSRVCAIAYLSQGGRAIGSGNIIGSSTGTYICTARHVAEGFLSSGDAQIAFFGGGSLRRHEVESFAHSHDRFDLSLLRLKSPRQHYYDIGCITPCPRLTTRDELVLYGAPAQWVRIIGSKQDVTGLLYYTNIFRGPSSVRSLRHQIRLHYPEAASEVRMFPPSGGLPQAPGMSGAFVLNFPLPQEGLIWTPGSLRILGVQVAWVEHKYLIATKSQALIDLLRDHGIS